MTFIRRWVQENSFPTILICGLFLVFLQMVLSELAYHRLSIAMIFFVFTFKSWVNFVFAITTHRQKGESALSIAIERYFWALCSQSIAFSILFLVVFMDVMGVRVFGMDLFMVRNMLRSVAIISVVAVIIYGDQTLDALMAYLKREKATEGKPYDHVYETPVSRTPKSGLPS